MTFNIGSQKASKIINYAGEINISSQNESTPAMDDKELQEIKRACNHGNVYEVHAALKKAISTIEGLKERNKPLDEKLIQEIAEKCADLNNYDDDDFTPPESVPGGEDNDFWDWIQELLRTSAKNALGMLGDSIFSEIERLKRERDFFKEERDRCERLERKAYEQIEGLKGEVEQLKQVFSYDSAVTIIRLQNEVERYRTALEDIASGRFQDNFGYSHIARKALEDSHEPI